MMSARPLRVMPTLFPSAAILERIKTTDPEPPRRLDEAISRRLNDICLKALARRVTERYLSARELAADLRHWQEATLAGESSAQEPTSPVSTGPSLPGADSGSPLVRVVPKGLRSFDARDADFFLDLLPGPRDRHGLPEGLRCWKARIEAKDPAEAFSVGLLYGPSGCDKSSLVKAGLLPRLTSAVRVVFVEATAEDTERRLLRGVRSRCPELANPADLTTALRDLRCHPLSGGRGTLREGKVLLVLDQFEQWLHAHAEEEAPPLVEALRQCDGPRLQALVLVRDDFWMATTRFFRALEVPLREGENAGNVDLFDLCHARKVLASFGAAYPDCLPDDPGLWSPDQNRFLDEAVRGLAQDGKVIPVRLSLFAEMVKGRPWTPETLRAVGGAEGVGVTFLEETFSATRASPRCRQHEEAARGVLRLLVPDAGVAIKGHRRSREELVVAAGYQERPEDFNDLVHLRGGDRNPAQ